MDQHTISSMMFCSTIKCLQGGCHTSWLQNWKKTCWCLPGTFETLWSRRWQLSRKNCYWRWNLVPLPPARNQESEQGMAPYILTKTKKIPHATMCGKVYADSLLGWMRGNFGALHAHGEHCDQCNVCRSQESPVSCHQVQTTWTSEYRCSVATWQCLAPYCLFNCCNMTMLGPILPVQLLQYDNAWPHTAHSTVAIWQCLAPYCPFSCCNMTMLGPIPPVQLLQYDNAWPHTARSTVAAIQDLSFECLPLPPYSPDLTPCDFHVFGPLKEAMGGKSFRSDKEVQQAVHKWLHSQPKYFFLEASMHFRSTGTLVWNALETT